MGGPHSDSRRSCGKVPCASGRSEYGCGHSTQRGERRSRATRAKYDQSAMNPVALSDMTDRVFGDRYRIQKLVGVGPISAVFAAQDLTEDRQVALKVFSHELADNDQMVEELLEATATAAVLTHPNIADVYDWGIDGGPYVVSELCEGGSLANILDAGDTLASSQALVMALECARALNHGHEQGQIHRKLHPRNVMFTSDQRVRVTDFGIAAATAAMPIAQGERAIDNVRYLAPEQARGLTVGEAADLYALALVANEAVSGIEPEAADTLVGTLMERAEAPAYLHPALGDLLQPLERCGRVDPDQRPEAEELAIGLLATAESMPRPDPLPLAGATDQIYLFDESRLLVVGGIPSAPDPLLDGPDTPIGGIEAVSSSAVIAGVPNDAELPDGVVEGGTSLLEAPELDPDDDFDVSALGDLDDLDAFVADEDHAPAELSLVTDEPATVALEDLDLAEPAFAEVPETDVIEPSLDVPSRAPVHRTSPVYEEQQDDADDKLPLWPLILLVLLVAGAVAAVTYLFAIPAAEDAAIVPDLIDMPFDEIDTRLGDHEWIIDRLEGRATGFEPGAIIAQSPAAGAELDDGEELSLTVSLGNPMVEIPSDVVGLSRDQAASRLVAAGLAVGRITEEENESFEAGLVIGFDEPTTQKPLGEGVDLRVSSGPQDRVVPGNLVGQSIADATTLLVGLRLQPVEESAYSADVEAGTVLGSFPGAGEVVAADSAVTLIISAGPEPVEMPDIVDLDLDQAVDVIEELGLIFVDTQGTPGEPVIGSLPPIGAIAEVGTEVTIILADPPEDEEEDG